MQLLLEEKAQLESQLSIAKRQNENIMKVVEMYRELKDKKCHDVATQVDTVRMSFVILLIFC